MKKSLSILFAALFILVTAGSLFAADLKVNGEYRVRGYSYNTLTGFDGISDGADYIDQRFLVTGSVAQGMTTGIFELNLSDTTLNTNNGGAVWGQNLGGSGYANNNSSAFMVHQAYMKVTFPMTDLYAGRRIVKLGHGLILNETADNLAVSLPLAMLNIDVAYLKIFEADTSSASGQDLDDNGILLNVELKPTDNMNIGLFYITDTTKVVGAFENDKKTAFGISADGQAGPLGVNVELDMLGGSQGGGLTAPSYKGTNLLLNVNGNVGVGVVGLAYLRSAGSGCAAGDPSCTDVSNNSIAGNFTGGHGILLNDQTTYGGGVNINTRVVDTGSAAYTNQPALNSNFHALKLYGVTKPTADSEAGIEIFPLVQLVDAAVLFTNLPGASTDTNLGQEFNIYGGVNLDKNLKLSGVVAFFNTGDVIKDISPTGEKKNVTKFNAALTYTF